MAVPHLRLKSEVLAPTPEPAEAVSAKTSRLRPILVGVLLVALLGAGGFFGWKHYGATLVSLIRKPAAPATPTAATASTPASPAAKAAPAAPAPGPATPSETLNKLAHAPAAAIAKAQDAIAAKRATEQARVDATAFGEDVPGRKIGPAPAAPIKPAAPAAATAKKELSPGLSATTQVEAAADASPEFRTFVANVKVSGVFQGAPARAMINGKLTRVGETVDGRLGIVFDGVDSAHRNLMFKDRSGALVGRRY